MKKETIVMEKFVGSKFWLWFWIFMFWPIAIIYYFTKKEPIRVTIKNE